MGSVTFGAIGSAIAGPVGGFFGSLFGSIIDQAIFAPKQPGTEGPRLDDLKVTTANPGSTIPIVFGTARISTTLLASGDLIEDRFENTAGGKGGLSAPQGDSVNYSYYANIDYLMCQGPILGVSRMWVDGVLVRGESSTLEGNVSVSNTAANPENAGGLYYPTRYQNVSYDPALVPKTLDRNAVATWDGLVYTLNVDKISFTLLDPEDFQTTISAGTIVYWKDTASGYYIPCLESHAYSSSVSTDKRSWEDYYNLYDAINDFSARAVLEMSKTDDITIYYGKDQQDPDPTMTAALAEDVPGYNGRAHMVFTRLSLEDYGNRIPSISVEVVQSDTTRVRDVIDYFMEASGILPAMYDYSSLPETGVESHILGYVINADASHRTSLETLFEAYNVEATDDGNQLVFFPKYDSEVVTIDYSDITTKPASSEQLLDGTNITKTYADSFSLPRQLYLAYSDPDRDYNTNVVHYSRHFSENPSVRRMQTSAVLPFNFARELVRLTLRDAWLEATRLEFTLPYKFFFVKPGDILRIMRDGEIFLIVKIKKKATGDNGVIEIEAVLRTEKEYSITEENISSIGSGGVYSKRRTITGSIAYSVFEPLDIPPVSDQQADAFGTYFGTYVLDQTVGWNGAAIYRRYNPGGVIPDPTPNTGGGGEEEVLATDFTFAKTAPIDLTYGTVTESFLGAANPSTLDFSSTIRVTLLDNRLTLNSVSVEEFFDNRNTAVIGNEIVSFLNADVIEPGVYELSGFIRGIKATSDDLLNTHVANERFVQLDANSVKFMPELINKLDVPVSYKSVSSGTEIADAQIVNFSTQGNFLKPLPPVMLTRVSTVGDTITVSWQRQDRRIFGWTDYTQAILSEDTEEYNFRVLNPDATLILHQQTVVDANTASFSFTALQIPGAPTLSTLLVEVAQISAILGEGHINRGYV